MLRRYPGLTLVSTFAIAVAIALGTLYFEGLNKWRNPRLPVADPDRIVSIRNWDVAKNAVEGRMLQDFSVWREQLRTIDHLGAAYTFQRNLATDDGRIEPVRGAEITANAFSLVEARPILGRALTDRDEQPGEPPVMVISSAVWKTRFNNDQNVLGKTVKLGTASATIVGVMPDGFGFPVNHRVWVPLRANAATIAPRTGPSVSIFGRLAPDASLDDAQAELSVIGARLSTASPETHKNLRPRVSTYAKPLLGGEGLVIRNVLYAVNGIFVLLLAIMCTNVATLVFARTATRGWEMAVRAALGATRKRIIGQLFVEALVLSSAGAVLGLIIARVAMRYGLAMFSGSDSLPYWIDADISWRTILYAALLATIGGAIIGVLPALRVTRVNVQDALRREGAAGSSLRFGGFWTTVIVVQVAITVAFIPLAGGGVFESNRFNQRAHGIGADRFLTASVSMDPEGYVADSAALAGRARVSIDELQRRLAAEPGVERVAFADRLPVADQFKYEIAVDSSLGAPTSGLRVSTLVHVAGDFFGAFGTAITAGRAFAPHDYENGRVIMVNQSFVHHVLGDRNAIGQRVRIVAGEDSRATGKEWYEIIGVVRDFGWQLPEPREQSAIYRPKLPLGSTDMSIAVRVRDPDAFGDRLRTIAAEVDPTLRLTDVQRLTNVGGGEAKTNWALTWVAWVVSFVVLVLSCMGIHALMSFIVTRRTREIGVRIALGASAKRIVGGIFSRAFIQIAIGIIVGSALSAIGGLSGRGLSLLLTADAIMLAAGLAACAVPLRRALSVNPTEALRAEG
jgi:predicted permease